MALQNKLTQFATKGFRAMRLNPDGTIPVATRFLGFANTVDLSSLTLGKGMLTLKIDAGAEETKEVDFSAADDDSAVTVAEAVTALNTAAFAGITWSADSATGRLKGAAASGTYIQVYGAVAPLLDFGQSLTHGGLGLKWVKAFDATKSYTVAKTMLDKEEIDTESADGTINTMVYGARLKGADVEVVLRAEDFDFIEMVEGGEYDRTEDTYDPPGSDQAEHPTFFMEFYGPKYAKGSVKLADLIGYKVLTLRTCQGMSGDDSGTTKAWTEYPFSLNATEYTDEDGNKLPAYQYSNITKAVFEARDVENA